MSAFTLALHLPLLLLRVLRLALPVAPFGPDPTSLPPHPQRPRTLSRPLRRSHAPCPGDLPAHPRRAYGPTRPVAGPSLGAVVPGVRSSESRSKKSAQTVSRQPVPSGDGLARDGSPLHPHASAAHAHPAVHVRSQPGRPSPSKVGPDMPALALTGGTPVRAEPFPAWPVFPEQDIAALADRLRAGDRSDDDPVIEFEQAFAAAHGARYGIGLNSGTSALEIALQALRLDRGAEVIVSPITFFASVSAILNAGLVPIFADIDPDTYNIAPSAIEAAITPRTGAIMTVHFGGVSCDMQPILAIAQRHGLAVIEDVSHAHGGTWNDRGLGSIGDVGCFSCGSGKNLSAGGGGVLITNDPRHLRTRQRLRRTQPSAPPASTRTHRRGRDTPATEEFFPYASGNRRLHPVHAVLGLPQLSRLDEQTARRDANGRYLAGLLDDIEGVTPRRQDALPPAPPITSSCCATTPRPSAGFRASCS